LRFFSDFSDQLDFAPAINEIVEPANHSRGSLPHDIHETV